MDRVCEDPEALGPYAWTGWSGLAVELRRRWEDNRLLGPEGGMLAVVCEDAPVGMVSWREVAYNVGPTVWNVGLCILPEGRRSGHALQAGRQLVDYLFAHTPAHRIEAHVDVGNTVMAEHIMEQVGFSREGVLRGAAYRAGEWRDMLLFGLLRTDPLPFPEQHVTTIGQHVTGNR